ncbi:MAG: sigma-70 family RNA polymerase sigma factor [Bacteroidetes bacterium]|nr:sigma-70 family RNA polymerase sigma factor [Bacteroidota bacterium]
MGRFMAGKEAKKRIDESLRHKKFTEEMVPYMDMLYSYAFYLSNDREQANDLLQDTFMKAYRFYDRFESGTNAKAWLHRIMKNTYINEYRRTHRLPEIVEYDEHISAYQMIGRGDGADNDLRTMLDTQMFDDDITNALAALPEKFKSIIVLRDIEDMPYEEIAEVLEIPIGTVRSRLHRARALLFDRLKEYARQKGYAVGERFVPADLALAS